MLDVSLLAQNEDAAAAGVALAVNCCMLIFILLTTVGSIAGLWGIFTKAGQPGWAAIVPFYNVYVATQVAGLEILWFVLALIPCVQYVALLSKLAERFGKGIGFAIGMILVPFVFLPMLGFGSDRYQPVAGAAPPRKF